MQHDLQTGPTLPAEQSRIVDSFREIAPAFDVLICDIWGVLHNGVAAFEPAHRALTAARASGATVILLSNAPRPCTNILPQLDGLGVPRNAYDAIVTSGDITRRMLIERGGTPFYLLGPDRDLPLFEGIDTKRTTIGTAEYVLCTGLFDDETETPEDYDPVLKDMLGRDLEMLCANPDLVVERGDRLIFCAGSIAERYAEMGGRIVLIGKPYGIAYEAACAQASMLRSGPLDKARTLGIGDAIRTDVRGAKQFGINSLFVASGIHAAELLDATGMRSTRRGSPAFLRRSRSGPTSAAATSPGDYSPKSRHQTPQTASILVFRVWALKGLTI